MRQLMNELLGNAVNACRPRAKKLAVDRQSSNSHGPITLKHRQWIKRHQHDNPCVKSDICRKVRINWIALPVNGDPSVNVKEQPI